MFANICGDKYARNVGFLTTMWDKANSIEELRSGKWL
jgi:hypothetical protein